MKRLPLLLTLASLAAIIGSARTVNAEEAADDPIEAFLHPGPKAHVGVWWHWMGDTVTREGIVKDLDWFMETGITSATIFGMADICTPWATKIKDSPQDGLVAFTPAWWELVRFAAEEAEKRGLELGLHNCPGYTSTGGPWITPDLAMRELVFNVTNVEKQIKLEAHADFPVFDERIQRVERPKIAARRTDYQDLGTFNGIKVGHIPMGAFVQPAQWEAFGLECDKMNPEAIAFHLDHVIADLKKYVGSQLGRGLKFILLDSYEAGTPTWTPRMREEFQSRKGYDPMPLLPVLGGFQVTDEATAKKFKEDFAAVRRDLFRDVLFKTMHEKLSAVGLEFACEPYTGPFDSRECAAHVDRLMTEFWFSTNLNRKIEKPLDWQSWSAPNGKTHRILEAEAFTGKPEQSSWTETPAQLKACGDIQFLRGINRFTLHTCPLQPWGDRVKPGATMGRWGTHFGRNQTWAKDGKAWFSYLARCQSLLQWGQTLSLGDCNGQVAHVWLNGQDLGVAWCAPWEVIISGGILKEKGNRLKIDFTNVWANRLIGDEQEPQDCEFVNAPPYFAGQYLKRWPKWFQSWASGTGDRPSSGRQCFTPWNYFSKDSKLVSSGLRGPLAIK